MGSTKNYLLQRSGMFCSPTQTEKKKSMIFLLRYIQLQFIFPPSREYLQSYLVSNPHDDSLDNVHSACIDGYDLSIQLIDRGYN